MNDTYAANVDWVATPKFFVNLQSGYYVYDSTSPAEFAGTALIHSFAQSNTCTGAAGSATCPFPEIPANLQQISGYADNKSTSRTLQDRYDRAYFNVNTTLFKSLAGEHQFKFGARYERLGNDVDSGAQLPTVSLNWNRAFTHCRWPDDAWRLRLLHDHAVVHAGRGQLEQLELLGAGQLDDQEQLHNQRRRAHRERACAVVQPGRSRDRVRLPRQDRAAARLRLRRQG